MVVASGQSIERTELVTPVDLMARACEAAFAHVPALRAPGRPALGGQRHDPDRPAPATELAGPARARRLPGLRGHHHRREQPQWLVNRAAGDIAGGALSVTLIAGAEAIRSSRARRAAGLPRYVGDLGLPPDPVVGDDLPGVGPAESAIGLLAPVHVYPLFESVVAARAGHDAAAHRQAMGRLFAPFTGVAAANPFAWFPEVRTAEDIATPSPDNRIVSEPYTKRMTAFLGSDQGAALVVCSLAAARRAGVADRAVFVWSGPRRSTCGSRPPAPTPAAPRPSPPPVVPSSPPPRPPAGPARAGPARAGPAPSGSTTRPPRHLLVLPFGRGAGRRGAGPRHRRRPGLTVTGGLPYFGGPGNNYTTHGIAAVTDALRDSAGPGSADAGAGHRARLVRHQARPRPLRDHPAAPGVPPRRHRADQAVIDASAVEMALEVDVATPATVVAATVVRDHDGAATGAPLIARLPDGRHMAAGPGRRPGDPRQSANATSPASWAARLASMPGAPRYRLATA